ncbi:MAG TPA: YidC/Oxa1 family membrane protein insertase [Acidimicrobiales bacterium]|nr:YidC/Oxa1 family membrane protein insertase [Acidimicrobiales bacterium]
MFDALFTFIAQTLSFFYDLVPNYAVAIAMLTLIVMVATTPFTLKGTRSMIQMQRLQPEMRRLQLKYKDDRQKLNEELMAFYKENQLNPLGGCLPMLLQAPIFIILFNVILGLTRFGEDGLFDPKYLDHTSNLFRDLNATDEMIAFGVDLAETASNALSESFVHGLPHLAMVAIVAVSSYYQQKQIQGRNPNAEMPPQQKMLMRLMPIMFVVFAFVSPAALVVYFVVSNLYRIGMQHYITRTLYHGEDSLGAQAHKASAEAKKLKEQEGGTDVLPRLGRKARATEATATDTTGASDAAKPSATKGTKAKATATTSPQGGSSRNGSGPPRPTSRTGAQNRSKKKKKRR